MIEAEISDAPLDQVARELERWTQTRVILTDPASASWRISAFVKAKSFGEGIRQILNGYSYAIYPIGAETPVIVVLSTRRNLPTPTAIPVAQGLQSAAQVEAPAESDAEDLTAEDDHDADSVTSLTHEQRQEALLTKALAMLKSGNRQLHAQAIDQLASIHDARATQALIGAANGDGTADPRSRVQAAESLWNHAAELEFSDQASVNALKRLATDRDTNVRNIARQALADMQQQQETLIQAMQR
jgi:HEAT repeat protein